MRTNVSSRIGGRLPSDSGQVTVFILLALGIFLLGAIGFGVDIANLWFHRQAAQTAADAACTAGAMDMLVQSEGAGTFSWINQTTDCPANSATIAPCWYAAHNGYNSSGLVAGSPSNKVTLSYPGSVLGVTTPPPNVVAVPFLQVSVTDRVKVFFAALLSGSKTMDVGAKAVCGVLESKAPVPIIVMNPSCPHAFEVSGSSNVSIIGGPTRSIQVNSANQTCAAATSNAGCPTAANGGCPPSNNTAINLCLGGPNFDGSSFGNSGAPSATPDKGFATQNGGSWQGTTPISDPYMLTPAPSLPGAPVAPPNTTCTSAQVAAGNCTVGSGVNGCSDNKGCVEYTPGLYTSAIVVKNVVAIFDPGIYYITGTVKGNCGSPGTGCVGKPTGQCRYGLVVNSTSIIRPSIVSGNGNGTMFYFSGASGAGSYGSVFFDANSGKPPGSDVVTNYSTADATCSGGTAPPAQLNIPASVSGNVLLGQCTGGGTYIGNPNDSAGTVRGLIFFDDRANADPNGQPSLQGGGQMILSGNMYFHNCNAAGTGTGCTAPAGGYNAFFQLQGNPGGTTYVLGNITSDEVILGGNGVIAMSLNPNAIYNILKATLLQ